MQTLLSTASRRGPLTPSRTNVTAALLQPPQHLHCRLLSCHAHATIVSVALTGVQKKQSRHRAPAATSKLSGTAGSTAVCSVQTSLDDLQQLAAKLEVDPSADRLLNAYQQLRLIQKRILQEQRERQTHIARSKWLSSYRTAKSSRSHSTSPLSIAGQNSESDDERDCDPRSSDISPQGGSFEEGSGQDGNNSTAAEELQELKQLRQKCDDAQDFLVGLIQKHLQDEPPSAATRLLTTAAYRQLNVAAINRTCVNMFLDKQADASASDMAALMTALALVRCCSKSSHQVEGLGRNQLAALFGGTMTHLIAFVERALQGTSQQVQQLQQQEVHRCFSSSSNSRDTGARGRRRRSALAAAPTPAQQPAAGGQIHGEEDLQRQVAAGVAAHVSGRVPLSSALIPHILQLLGDQAPAWLHPITALQSATSVTELQSMISQPSRYDYTYLAAALHRLSELVETQQLAAAAQANAAVPAASSEFAQANRLARRLYGRLQQLQEDATPAEIVCVLAAAAKMGVADGKVYSTAAMQLVDGEQLQQATSAQVVSVMYAIAWYCSNTGGGDGSFGKHQQQHVLKQCLHRMTVLMKQQQQPAAKGETASSSNGDTAAVAAPADAVMALWSVATCGLQLPAVLITRLLKYLAEPSIMQALLGNLSGSSSAAGEPQQQQHWVLQHAARNSCTVVWAVAQLQRLGIDQTEHIPMIQTYLQGFVMALRHVSVSCTSITSVLQSLATLLAAQQQLQSSESAIKSRVSDEWRAVFLRCSDEVVRRVLQEQQQSAAAAGHAGAEDMCSVSAACQLVCAHQIAGITLPNTQLMTLLTALSDQAPCWLLEAAISRASSTIAILDLLQTPAAANADLACIAAAFKRLVDLRVQHVAAAAGSAASGVSDLKLWDQQVTECARKLSAFTQSAGIPNMQQSTALLHQQGQDAADQEQGSITQQQQQPWCPTTAAVASAAAMVLWATAQLQHRDMRLCSSCLQLFHTTAESATTDAAAAVINAMAAAGRKLPVVYKDQGMQCLQEVLQICTAKLLAAPLALQAELMPQQQDGTRRKARKRDKEQGLQQQGELPHAHFCSGSVGDVLLAQNILQLHAVVGLQLPQQQLHILLATAADDATLAALSDRAAAAALVAVLAAVAELSQLPASQQVGAQQNTWSQPTGQSSTATAYEQQLLEELLMHGLLPRIASATPKQIATSLEALAELAIGRSATTAGGTFLAVELAVARDYARAVFDALVAPSDLASGDAPANESCSSAAEDFLLGWKGEHAASVAVAALRLGVACPKFFAAVASDLLIDAVVADVSATFAGTAEHQKQQQRKRSRVLNVQLEHLVTLCCSAAALQCRTQQLLAYAVQTAQTALTATANSCPSNQQSKQTAGTKRQLQQQLDPVQAMQLAWCTAVMDVPELQLQAKQLVTAAAEALAATAVPAGHKANSATTSVGAAAAARIPDQLLSGVTGLAARMFQLHIWLADRQVQAAQLLQQQQQWLDGDLPTATAADDHHSHVAGATVPAADAEFGLALGLSDVLTPKQLLKAGQQWLQMQVAAAAAGVGQQLVVGDWRLAAVAQVVQELPGIDRLSAVTATADGWVRLDLEARVRGVPVAVLLLNDSDEEYILGGGGYVARHLMQDQQVQLGSAAVQGVSRGQNAMNMRPQNQPQAKATNTSSGLRRPLSSHQLLQECLAYEQVGDVMFRARALAARGYWVAVISWQVWSSLQGVRDAELAYLQEKLWLLQQSGEDSDAPDLSGQQNVAVGMPVAAAMSMQHKASPQGD